MRSAAAWLRLFPSALLIILTAAASAALDLVPTEIYAASPVSSCVPVLPCSDPRGCPDLVVDPNILLRDLAIDVQRFSPRNCSVVEGEVGGAGARRLLLFSSNTPNLGGGDLTIGDPLDHPELFDFQTCHGHVHFKEYADYRLWTPQGFQQWQALRERNRRACARDLLSAHPEVAAQMVAGHKQGFCVGDLLPSELPCPFPADPQKYFPCETFVSGNRTFVGNQGISVCWADEYGVGLSGQWIDITGLPAGEYILEDEVNAERLFEEADYSNNSSAIQVTIPAP